MKFKVVFRGTYNKYFEELAQKELIRGHNYMADHICTEEFYKKHNKEFDSLYPNVDTGDEGAGYDFYNKWMQNVMQKAIDSGMNERPFSPVLKYEVGDECNLVGVLWHDPTQKIEFYLVPIQD